MDIYPKSGALDFKWVAFSLIASLFIAATAIHKNIHTASSVTPKLPGPSSTLSLAERTEETIRLFEIKDKENSVAIVQTLPPKQHVISNKRINKKHRRIDSRNKVGLIRSIIIPTFPAAYRYPQIEGKAVEINNRDLIALKALSAASVTSNWAVYFENFRTEEGKTLDEQLLVLAKKEKEAAEKSIQDIVKDEVRTIAARSVEFGAPELMDIQPGIAQQEISIDDKVSQRVLASSANEVVQRDPLDIIEDNNLPTQIEAKAEAEQVHEIMLSPEPAMNVEPPKAEVFSPEVAAQADSQLDTQVSSQLDAMETFAPPTPEVVDNQAASETIQEATAQVEIAAEGVTSVPDPDDFVVYDYAQTKAQPVAPVDTRSYSSKVSSTVKQAIAREIKDSDVPQLPVVADAGPEKELAVEDVATLFNSMAKKSAPVVDNDLTDLDISIHVESVEFNTGKREPVENFEVKPYYASDVILDDEGTGIFNLKERVAQGFGVFAVAVTKEGHFQTDVDLQFAPEVDEKNIPLIERESWNTYAEANGIMNQGAMILVEKTEEVEKIEIDVPFEKLIYLDNTFKITEDVDLADYLLFVGARSGNVLLTYTTIKKVQTAKIIFAQEDGVYFDWPLFEIRPQEILEVVEGYVLENGKSALDIDAQSVFSFNNGIVASKKGQNRYEIVNNVVPRASRMYLEMSHLEDTIFVGRWDAETLEVPSEEYILTMLSKHGFSGLGGRCMVQVNIEKGVMEVKVEARTANGQGGPLRITYLDKDGRLYEEAAESVKKIFLIGEQQGVMDAKISYMDGTVDYLQTYCSPDTYLVEQF